MRPSWLPATALLVLALVLPAVAQPAPPGGRGGSVVSTLAGDERLALRAEVDAAIASAIALERAGDRDGAVEHMRQVVSSTRLGDAKARYFLARAYLERAKARPASEASDAAQDRSLALVHLRSVPELVRGSPLASDAEWAHRAQARLRDRARGTPVIDQHTEGTYPKGYCGPTAVRMVLRREGLPDPGADAVALGGAAPYTPGPGSDPERLASRAAQLGLSGASFTPHGRLVDLGASLDAGRPVLVAGKGPFSATLQGGARKQRSYPSGHWLVAVGYERGADGGVSRVELNDPDGGVRLSMTRGEFLRFFSPEGEGHIWMLRYTR